MEIKTFRAKTMPEALDLVRRELGPEAMVLHTRELNGNLVRRMLLGRSYEVAAAESAPAPRAEVASPAAPPFGDVVRPQGRPAPGADVGLDLSEFSERRAAPPASPQVAEFQSLVEQLRARSTVAPRVMPTGMFDVFTQLIEADVDEAIARELVDRLRRGPSFDARDRAATEARLVEMLVAELRVAGPIPIRPGAGRVAALVGPTGVGKTTTIAKLAANYRLRDNRRVGLITVDTYRIAAVEQLRTYADIIDLPMEVVSTPREMREACQRMRDFDLVLMDTAGRSPRDEVRIRELRAMLAEAAPDEVHLVLSAASSARGLVAAAEKFSPVGVTSLIVTKLDEATALGNLLSLVRSSGLPFSYLTDGQNVPDDIAVADAQSLAQLILNANN
jgi:flagellar biosynthesis protein FlhF